MLVLLVAVGAFSTTAHRMHIALREPATKSEHRLSQGTQLVVHVFWMISCLVDYQVQMNSSAGRKTDVAAVVGGGLCGAWLRERTSSIRATNRP